MPLHIDYRPKNLEEFIGNQATINSLRSVLTRKDIPHALLFTGPSGCGKTTLARISANMLGCSDMDFRELNTADFRGIDTAREIIQQMRLKPLRGKCRVWLIDECHMGTREFQSAILKALEDTPAHVYFMLATTDPQKLLPTILNRCSMFPVEKLTGKQLAELIKTVLEAEGMDGKFPANVVDKIAEAADGSPRAALVMLDKVIDLKSEQDIEEALSRAIVDEAEVIDLCRALIALKPWKQVYPLLGKLKDKDPEQIRRAVIGYASSILLKGDDKRAALILDVFRIPTYDNGFAQIIWATYETLRE